MKDEHRGQGIVRTCIRWLVRIAVGVVLILVGGLVARAFIARGMPDLERWHTIAPASEFSADMAAPDFGFDQYMDLEQELFDGLSWYLDGADKPGSRMRYSRYIENGPNNPSTFATDWNRSIELTPAAPRGGALLLHGLSDSSYSLRSIAELLHRQGYYVLAMRMPGHGTVPAGLLEVTWRDWVEAAKIGARRVSEVIGDAGPLVIVGYSNGGSLAMKLTLDAIHDDDVPKPDRIVLFSPAIGITPFAAVSSWYRLVSWIPYFEKNKWLSIEPEIDPYKYNSFPQNAGAQIYALTGVIQKELANLDREGRLGEIPPILTFQSIVDSTIVARDVVSHLYRRLEANGSELVVFDANQLIRIDNLFTSDPDRKLFELQRNPDRAYRLTVITNKDGESRAVVARSAAPGSSEIDTIDLGLAWPRQVYSLAHVAIPFPPDDPIYGETQQAAPGMLPLGSLALRGETGLLTISAAQMMRLRHNPFHSYMLDRIAGFIAN